MLIVDGMPEDLRELAVNTILSSLIDVIFRSLKLFVFLMIMFILLLYASYKSAFRKKRLTDLDNVRMI